MAPRLTSRNSHLILFGSSWNILDMRVWVDDGIPQSKRFGWFGRFGWLECIHSNNQNNKKNRNPELPSGHIDRTFNIYQIAPELAKWQSNQWCQETTLRHSHGSNFAKERFVFHGQCNDLGNSTVDFNPKEAAHGMELGCYSSIRVSLWLMFAWFSLPRRWDESWNRSFARCHVLQGLCCLQVVRPSNETFLNRKEKTPLPHCVNPSFTFHSFLRRSKNPKGPLAHAIGGGCPFSACTDPKLWCVITINLVNMKPCLQKCNETRAGKTAAWLWMIHAAHYMLFSWCHRLFCDNLRPWLAMRVFQFKWYGLWQIA